MGAAVTAEPKSKKSKPDLSAETAPAAESTFQLDAVYGATAGMPLFLDIGVQRKLAVGAVDDPLEREADQVADQVMRMPDAAAEPYRQARTTAVMLTGISLRPSCIKLLAPRAARSIHPCVL